MAKKDGLVAYPRLVPMPLNLFPEVEYRSIVEINPSEMAEWRTFLNYDAFDTLTDEILDAACDTLYLCKYPSGYDFMSKKCVPTEYLKRILDDILDEESYLKSNGNGLNPYRYIAGTMSTIYNPVNGNIIVNFRDCYTSQIRLTFSMEIRAMLLICDNSGTIIKRYVKQGHALELYAVAVHHFEAKIDGISYSEPKTSTITFAISAKDFNCIEQWLHYNEVRHVQSYNLISSSVNVNEVMYSITFLGHEIKFSGPSLEYRLAKYLFKKAKTNHSVMMANFYEAEYREECWNGISKKKQAEFKAKVYQAIRQLNNRISKQLGLGKQKSVIIAKSRVSLDNKLLGLSGK